MANYDNQYSMSINAAKPTLRGIDTNYSTDGQTNLGGIGLGDLYQVDYDRNAIEKIFNQGTDAQYALMQKENQIAQNQYANNQFANQQNAIETLRAQRNSQIATGMSRGLSAAQEQGTVLGLQQENSAGALELANAQQLAADKIAASYAENVTKALEQSNAVKQAMAGIAAQMYEADMLGYTGELSANAQMDANASDRYGYDLGLEGTRYSADKGLEGTIYTADKDYEGNVYNADRNLEGTKYAADKNYSATIGAANISASAQRAAASIAAAAGGSSNQTKSALDEALDKAREAGKTGNDLINTARAYLVGNSTTTADYANMDQGQLWDTIDAYAVGRDYKQYTKKQWENGEVPKAPRSIDSQIKISGRP